MFGTRLLKCWSLTKADVVMRLGEIEFYGALKGASIRFGLKALYRDIGYMLFVAGVDGRFGGCRDLC